MGEAGLRYEDFLIMTPEELESVLRALRERDARLERLALERGRLFSVMQMQPHCNNKLDPREVLPFEWDRKTTTPVPDKETARKGLESFLRRVRR